MTMAMYPLIVVAALLSGLLAGLIAFAPQLSASLVRSRARRLPQTLSSRMVEEWLAAAEYLLHGGNQNVVLCERGIKTFDHSLRNTLDLAAVALVKELSHLPVIVDPSHATGKRSLIAATSRAALAIGADGVIVEVHPDPDNAWSDGSQSLSLVGFAEMMAGLSKPIQGIQSMQPVAAPA